MSLLRDSSPVSFREFISPPSVSLSLLRELSTMQNKLRKVCPRCSTPVHVKRAVCGCGYTFPSKRKSQSENNMQAMKYNTMDRLRKSSMRASETPEHTVERQEQDKLRKSRMRASETPEHTVERQEQDKLRKSSMRASETSEQALNR